MSHIPGYDHGHVERSPVSLAELEEIQKSVLFGAQDVKYLRQSLELVQDRTEEILDVWYGFVGSQPHLLRSFTDPKTGAPLAEYLTAVRKRFGRWILDTARAEYDQRWLDYQHEIGLRHHRAKKNRTDGASSTELVPFRSLFALVFPVTFTLRPFLAARGHSADEVDKMYGAWLKSCLVQVTLWSHPYVKAGDF
jgi:hypothetical protein